MRTLSYLTLRSPPPTGPFTARRKVLPDRNETHVSESNGGHERGTHLGRGADRAGRRGTDQARMA